MMTNAKSTGVPRRTPVQYAAAAVGVVFLLAGVLGFIPGITTHYDMLSAAGHHSGALLLGLFAVSVLHNAVHLAFGVAGLVLARTLAGARIFLIIGAMIFAMFWLYGFFIDRGSDMNFVPVNTADNWLHLALAIGMAVLGVGLGGTRADAAPHTPRSDSIQPRAK